MKRKYIVKTVSTATAGEMLPFIAAIKRDFPEEKFHCRQCDITQTFSILIFERI